MKALRPTEALQAIRQLELESAQSVEATRVAATESMAEVRRQVATILESARRRGRQRARQWFADQVAAAEQEARAIEAETSERIRELRERTTPKLGAAAEMMVDLVLASTEEEEEEEEV